MTPRPMTEPEAWREIARRIVAGEWDAIGLCREVWKLRNQQSIAPKLALVMAFRAVEHVDLIDNQSHPYAYHQGAEPEARALAALWLALEAEEEGV
jgi:hypothetical protein